MKKPLLFINGIKKIKNQLRLLKKLVNKFKLMLSRGEQNSYNYNVLIAKIKLSYAKLERLQVAPALKLAGTTLAMVLALTSNAQTFVARTGANNPLDNYSTTDARYVPSFADLNNDGDIDVLIGIKGAIAYAENTGTASAAIFTGTSSPISLPNSTFNYAPSLVDIDNDGDFDVFIGKKDGAFHFYENTGTVSTPVYTDMTGTASDPLTSLGISGDSKPVFIDIDNDNDFDLFIGDENGTIAFFENIGNATSPVLTPQSGSNNPFDGVDVGSNSSIDFIDGDMDGDMDAYIGTSAGIVLYYENTGTVSNAAFTQQTGANNPLNSISLGSTNWVNPRFVDMDNDGDMDVFVGEHNTIRYYENTTSIPTGISTNNKQLSVNIFPNPTTGQVTFTTEETIETIEIYNTTGKKIAAFNNVNTIDISNLNSGIYFAKITTQSNSIVQRIIKQ